MTGNESVPLPVHAKVVPIVETLADNLWDVSEWTSIRQKRTRILRKAFFLCESYSVLYSLASAMFWYGVSCMIANLQSHTSYVRMPDCFILCAYKCTVHSTIKLTVLSVMGLLILVLHFYKLAIQSRCLEVYIWLSMIHLSGGNQLLQLGLHSCCSSFCNHL